MTAQKRKFILNIENLMTEDFLKLEGDVGDRNNANNYVPTQRENIKSGDYVVVELKGLRNKFHYTARIDYISEDGEFDVTYLEKKGSKFGHEGPI